MGKLIAKSFALQLSGVLTELRNGAVFSDILQLDLTTSFCRFQSKRLFVAQNDSDKVDCSGVIRAWWIVDDKGIRDALASKEWPSAIQMDTDTFRNESPLMVFSTDGRLAGIQCSLGEQFYAYRKCELDSEGKIVTGTMREK